MFNNYSVMGTTYITHKDKWYRVEFLKNEIRGGLASVKYIAVTTENQQTRFFEFNEPINEFKFAKNIIEKHYA
ncbi:hypothetical protein ERX37_03355 [Macrococcus hajekii]|uniref:Uncharacterized protein n=1 Tax=Macrococcus hajekii TaxID=198482 RepID=A0A4R6BMT9_9STAP|nr:hypothetical protein [Macrococcus hajekii]TDM03136.1 hypothetical protein ERX37_03355 [Macrococcus hajekii]GGA96246.1 hypothetical protein GCM10007190_00370 [Macrococcus hajekii]